MILRGDFPRLWVVGVILFMVRWLEMLAVSLFVYERSGSAFLVAMLGMLRVLPLGLFGAFIGALAERVERRTILIVVVVASLASSAVLAWLAETGQLEIWHLAVASFLNGISWATDNPVRRMMIGEVVGAARMGRAMAADVGSNNASRMAGPTISGIVFAAFGVKGAFLISILLYGVALVAAVTLRARNAPRHGAPQGVLASIAAGISFVRTSRALQGTLVVTVIFNLFGWPFTSLVPVVGLQRLNLGPEAIGVLSSMDGVGAFLGALLIGGFLRPEWHRACYVGGVAGYCATLAAFAMAPHPFLAGFALLLTGFSQAGFSVMQATLIYGLAPVEMRGRVLGLLSVSIGVGPIGFLHVGLLAEAIGAPAACVVLGLEGLLALALTRRLWSHI